MGFNEQAKEIQKTMSLQDALTDLRSRELPKALSVTMNEKAPLDLRIGNHQYACIIYEQFCEGFKTFDLQAAQALKKAEETGREYEQAKARFNNTPKQQHSQREQDSLVLGNAEQKFMEACLRAEVFMEQTPRFLAALHVVEETVNRNARVLERLRAEYVRVHPRREKQEVSLYQKLRGDTKNMDPDDEFKTLRLKIANLEDTVRKALIFKKWALNELKKANIVFVKEPTEQYSKDELTCDPNSCVCDFCGQIDARKEVRCELQKCSRPNCGHTMSKNQFSLPYHDGQ